MKCPCCLPLRRVSHSLASSVRGPLFLPWRTESALSRWLDPIPGSYQRPPLPLSSHAQRGPGLDGLPPRGRESSLHLCHCGCGLDADPSLPWQGSGPSDWSLSLLLHLHPTAGFFKIKGIGSGPSLTPHPLGPLALWVRPTLRALLPGPCTCGRDHQEVLAGYTAHTGCWLRLDLARDVHFAKSISSFLPPLEAPLWYISLQ